MDFSKARPYPEGAATVSGCYSYLDCDVVIIDKYIPSRLDYDNLAIAMDELPGGGTVVFFDSSYDGTLAFLVPNDPSYKVVITIDGEDYDYAVNGIGDQPRYALVSGPFEIGCRVKLEVMAVNKTVDTPVCREPATIEQTVSPEEPIAAEQPAAVESPVAAEQPTVSEQSTPAAPAHDPALQLKSLRADNGSISFNDSRSRFFVALERKAGTVALSLPDGYEFEVDGECTGAGHVFTVNGTSFTGHEMRVYTPGRKSYRDYGLTVMQAPDEDAAGSCSVHAYTPIIGAFSGETCYVIDRTDPAVKIATHGTTECREVGIDPVTGYKWGSMGPGSYYFELENGGYEVLVSFTGAGARMIANPGTAAEKVIVRETSAEEQRYGVRVTEGQLVLSIVSDSEAVNSASSGTDGATVQTDISTLIIRAIDTIAIESGYVPLRDKPAQNAFSGLENIQKKKPTPERNAVRPEVQNHINNKLAAKKNQDAVKTIGIATGAIAVAAGIFSLLGKDKD